MAPLKKKHSPVIRQKKTPTNRLHAPPSAEALPSDWQEDVEKLKAQRFATVEQAVAALAAVLAERLAVPQERDLREFLCDLLLTDPTIRDVLQRELVDR